MRKVVVAEYLSLDGVGEDPGRIGDFQRRGWVIPISQVSPWFDPTVRAAGSS